MDILFIDEQRCRCGKLLLKGIIFDGAMEIKCKRCGQITKIGSLNLVDDATHYLLIIDKQGIIVNGSQAACYVLGYSHDELIGKKFSQISPTFSAQINQKIFGLNSVLNEDNYFTLDTFHKTKSGKKIPLVALFKSYQPTLGEKYLLISAEPKNTESKKNLLKHDVSKFLANACDFYFILDKNGIVEYINSPAEIVFGLSQDAFIGRNYFDYLSMKTRATAKKLYDHFSVNGEPFRAKVGGSELCFTPDFNGFGKFIGYRVLGWLNKKSKVKKSLNLTLQ